MWRYYGRGSLTVMIYRYEWEKTVWFLVILFSVGTLIGYFIGQFVLATAIEDKGAPTLKEQLLERAREWNIQKAINDTLKTAEDRFDPSETFHTYDTFDTSVCFNSQDLADDYYNQTGIHGIVPCPDFAISGIPKDESGK